jgi:hypothetical protein
VSPQICFKSFPITHADYLLFAGAVATKSRALCLAYTWNRNLDGKDETRDDVTPDENPGAAVVTLLDSGQTDLAIGTNARSGSCIRPKPTIVPRTTLKLTWKRSGSCPVAPFFLF